MNIFNFFNKKKKKPYRVYGTRNFASAKTSNLFANWTGTEYSADQELINNLGVLRNRVRQVCNDNEYARKFLFMMKTNIIHNGIRLQAVTKQDDGTLDKIDNDRIEVAWKQWTGNKNYVSANHRLNFIDMQRLVMETLARDGEVFIRKIKDDPENPFSYSLEILEGDWFDLRNNKRVNVDNNIVMSIEQDRYGRPIAYYKYAYEPGNNSVYSSVFQNNSTERILAEDIIHLYIIERPGQSRGIPWMNTVLRSLEMLEQYQESELVASRIGASAMGFYTSPDSQGYTGTGEDEQGNLITEFQPGTFQQLPDGMKFESFTPDHPTGAYPAFIKSILRGISSGLGISYAFIASDLESVNYSSIRAGVQEERSYYEMIQNFLIENFCKVVYKDWLRMAITSGILPFPMSKIEKFEDVRWLARGWDYVDPLKEIKAHQLATQMGIESLTEIASNKGKDLNEILEQLAKEKELVESLDLKLMNPITDDAEEVIDVD